VIAIEGQPILTAAEMRAAEEAVIVEGSSVAALMEVAGAGVAEAVRRLAAGAPALILCGPGNNGGDGYVAARILQANGVEVRIAAAGEPRSAAAIAARRRCTVPVEHLDAAPAAPILVDALFGTGLSRALDATYNHALVRVAGEARYAVAVDLPSGVRTDDGAILGSVPTFDLTLALGALKPAHVLQPAASRCGAVRIIDIGLGDVAARCRVVSRPQLGPPAVDAHKYSRGMVVVIGGEMPGASVLAAEAAMRAGAGYGLLFNDEVAADAPHALVRRPWSADALAKAVDGKTSCAIVVGPGLGRGEAAARKLDHAIAGDVALVIDGDALHLLDAARLDAVARRRAATVLTPHAGEFKAAFGSYTDSKIAATRRSAARSGAIVVFKGPDTVVATPGGDVSVAPSTSSWLSTAGTGDVLAGAVGAMLAIGRPPEAAVWMHGEAARRLGGSFVADDLVDALGAVRASL